MSEQQSTSLYGLMAEFTTSQALLDAIYKVKEAGYVALDAFTPFPIEEICEEVEDHKPSKVSLLVLIGALTGATVGFSLQWWVSAVAYPLNIGNRPLLSWPAFIPVTFELAVLFGAFSAVFGMFLLNGLPRPHHPVFNVKAFERATLDRYFLLIESADKRFDLAETREFLEGLGPEEVHDVDP